MLQTIARNRITLYRTSNEIADPFTPTTLTDGSPRVTLTVDALNTARYKAIVGIVVIPAPSTDEGSISIEGTDISGDDENEDIEIGTSGVSQGVKNWGSINQITIEGSILNNKSITLKFIGEDGGSIKARRTLATCLACQITRGRGSYLAQREGTVQKESIKILLPFTCSGTLAPREGDLVKDEDTGAEFIITGAPLYMGVGFMRHYELNAERYQGG